MDLPNTYPVAPPMTPTPVMPLNEEQQIDALLTEIHKTSPLRMFDRIIGLSDETSVVHHPWCRAQARKAIRDRQQENIYQRAARTGKQVVEWHGYKPFLR